MNLIEVQQSLQGLPDDYLIQQMRQPTGEAPQYLILSELQRRKKMRASAAQQPTSTVRQDVAGFAEGGSVSKENKPGWMSGGIGSLLGGGLMPMLLPGLNDIADSGDGSLLGFGAPWLLKQLGFGNKGEETDPAAAPGPSAQPAPARPVGTQLGIRGFAGRGEVQAARDKVAKSESGPEVYRANNRFMSKDGKRESQAIGRHQFTIETWNDYAKRLGVPLVKRGVKPGDPDWPTPANQEKLNDAYQADASRRIQAAGYDPADPKARKITQVFGPSGGPRMFQMLNESPDINAADAFIKALGKKVGTVALEANRVDPDTTLADAISKINKQLGGGVPEPVGGRPDDGIVRPSQAAFDADARSAISAPEDPDYLAWKAEQQASAPQLSSVPKASAWNGIVPEQEYQRPLRPNLGEPMNARGITELLQKLTPSRQLPGSKEPQPWQIIQQQGIAQHAQGGRVRGFSGGGDTRVKNGVVYRRGDWGDGYYDAQGNMMPPDGFYESLDNSIAKSEAARQSLRNQARSWQPTSDDTGLQQIGKSVAGMGLSVPAMIGEGILGAGELTSHLAKGAGQAVEGVGDMFGGIGHWLNTTPNQRAIEAASRPRTVTASGNMVNMEEQRRGSDGYPLPPAFAVADIPEFDQAKAATGAGGGGGGGGGFDTGAAFGKFKDQVHSPDVDAGIPRAVQDKDRDRWLALAEFGSKLASGTSPYFAQNFGPATSAGITSFRQSQSQFDDDQQKQAALRLQQAQIQEQASGRGDTTAATLTGVEGGIEEARIRAQAAGQRLIAAAQYGQSIDPSIFNESMKLWRDAAIEKVKGGEMTMAQYQIELKKQQAAQVAIQKALGLYKAQKGLEGGDGDSGGNDAELGDSQYR